MKTEEEIRRHLDAMISASKVKCGCSKTSHAMECLIGYHMMTAVLETLSWILDENPQHQDLVDHMYRASVRRKARCN